MTPHLPQFWLAEGQQLQESCRTALNILERDGQHVQFMIARDEVVYSKSWNLVYGMCVSSLVKKHGTFSDVFRAFVSYCFLMFCFLCFPMFSSLLFMAEYAEVL